MIKILELFGGIGACSSALTRLGIEYEIADVMVMLKQFQYYYGIEDKEIEEVMRYKINRQLERLNNEKDNKNN